MYLYVKDPNEAKYQYLIRKLEHSGLENLGIQRLLFNVQIVCGMSMTILKSTTHID